MAGGEDYIPIRTALVDDPDVRWIAQKLKKDPDLIVGKLVRFWSWAARVTANGRLAPYTSRDVDRLVGVKGFSEALMTFRPGAGWLAQDDGELVIPKWDEWMSDSAKARAGESVRWHIRNRGKTPEFPPEATPERTPEATPERTPEKTREQAEQSSKEQKRIAEDSEQAGSPRSGNPPVTAADAAAGSSARALCSMLLQAGIPGMKTTTAGVIGKLAKSEAHLAWAIERTKDSAPQNPVGYLRSLVANEDPPPAWVVNYNRRRLGVAGARDAMAAMTKNGGPT